MWTIRKKKDQHSAGERDRIVSDVIEDSKPIVLSILNYVAAFQKSQRMLEKAYRLLPNSLREPFTPLMEALLTPSLSQLIEHAKGHGLITDAEASQLLAGKITYIDGSQFEEPH